MNMNLNICYFILQFIIFISLLIILLLSNSVNVLIIIFFIVIFIKVLQNSFGYFVLSPLKSKNNKDEYELNLPKMIMIILTKKKMNHVNIEKMIINILLCIVIIKIIVLLFLL